jgi:hypothetical protein
VAALIFAWNLQTPLPCTVRDLSRSGARIELDYHGLKPPKGQIALPQRLMLHFCPMRTSLACRLAWREGRHFGGEFIDKCAGSMRWQRLRRAYLVFADTALCVVVCWRAST